MRLFFLMFMLCGMSCSSFAVSYSSGTIVSDPIEGDQSLEVSCPAGQYVVLSAANSFSGGTDLLSGGILVSNVAALGSGPIRCASGTILRVDVSYQEEAQTLTEAILSRVVVLPTEDGSDPWVSFQIAGEGLNNDVDFSGQPYLWLGSILGESPQRLNGTFEPYGNRYQFGYNGALLGEMRGIWVQTLTDAPDGTSRSVICRGKGTTTLNALNADSYTFTGGVVIEEGAFCAVDSSGDFGALPETSVADHVVLRSGGRLVLKNTNVTYSEKIGITIDGSGQMHSCGAERRVVTVFQGPLSGSGVLQLTDQGGVAFTHTNNTFTGVIKIPNGCTRFPVDVVIGNGTQFSWQGSEIETRLPNQRVLLNTDSNVVFSTKLSGAGPLVKQGKGTVRLIGDFSRTADAALPILTVEEGGILCGAENALPLCGMMQLKYKTSFVDVNGYSQRTFPIPTGFGYVKNSAEASTLFRFQGAVLSTNRFNGTIQGSAQVEVDGGDWLIGAATKIDGAFSIQRGVVAISAGVSHVEPFDVSSLAEVTFMGKNANGLLADFWLGCDWAAMGLLNRLDKLAYFAETETLPTMTTGMDAFGDTFVSGTLDGSMVGQPFTTILGGSKDHFAVRFTGSFLAETEGEYTFSAHADDAVRIEIGAPLQTIINAGPGTCSTLLTGKVTLTKGWHPIRVVFVEEGGWEVLQVYVTAPGESTSLPLPLRLLSESDGEETFIPQFSGEGKIGVSDGGCWPENLDLSAFSGKIRVNETTESSSIGALSLWTNAFFFANACGVESGFWNPYQTAEKTNINGTVAMHLVKGAEYATGAMNSMEKIPIDRAWKFSFDFTAIPPYGSFVGDGFSLVLHNSGVKGTNIAFSNGTTTNRIATRATLGMQFYMMTTFSEFAWIRDGFVDFRVAPVYTNRVFTMTSCKGNPMHVEMSYDGFQNLVMRLSRGSDVWCATNQLAKEDIDLFYPDGSAYLGIWGRCGGYYSGMLVDSVSLRLDGETKPVYAGPLTLNRGKVDVLFDGEKEGEVLSEMTVIGECEWNVKPNFDLKIASPRWVFDCASGGILKMKGPATFGAESIVVSFLGEVPAKPQVIADLTAVTGGGETPQFVLSDDLPKSVSLTYAGGILTVSRMTGTLLLLK